MNAVISLTTMPSRLPYIAPTIDSLKAQGLPVYVWIPKVVKRTGDVFDGTLPDCLEGCNVEVVDDRGPITKLLPALEMGAEVVITADDDIHYGRGPALALTDRGMVQDGGWAKGLLKWSEKVPGALGYRGRVFRSRKYAESAVVDNPKRPVQVDLVMGSWGALYRAEFFSDSLWDEWRIYPTHDDLVINMHLREKGIQRAVVPHVCGIHPRSVRQIDALFKVNDEDEGLRRLGWWS